MVWFEILIASHMIECNRIILEKLSVAQLVMTVSLFMEPETF